MLEPQTRATLTEQLAPPSGFELSRAVGTTFTLDLATALSVPLSFASRHLSTSDDTIGVLDAVRRVADRIDIFAQAGEISMGSPSDLVAFLEPIIHPVQVPRGLFHPKVWFLEYAAGERRVYRFLCASRNLTDDRSWDTIVRLDGAPADDGVARDENSPLVDLLAFLPGLSVNALPRERHTEILAFAERLHAVNWELPTAARDVQFHTVGIPGSVFPDFRGKRALIISPFATDEGLRMLRSAVRTTTHLLSRAKTLDALPPTALDKKLTTYVLDDAAIGDDADDASTRLDRLSGLHAKVVVVDRLDGSHVFLGSANATDAAWRSNVEVMVEFTGPDSKFGVNATLEALGELKEEYITEGGAVESEDEKAERRLEAMLRKLAGARLVARVLPGTPHSLRVWGEPDLEASLATLTDAGISLRWHLLTRADLGAGTLATDETGAVTIHEIPLTDITPFIALVAQDSEGRKRRTIVLARLLDDIPSRKDAIVARQLTDRAAFLRLLTLMLELSGDIADTSTGSGDFTFNATASDGFDGSGLFEALVRAVGAGHHGLADARRVVDYVREHGDEQDLLPEGFDELWSNVWDAHHSLMGGRL
ncbi:phospholipase D family protein [Microbacterium aerolatum]|uniref:phospholipase D family protein n=1 Tax=Microbacterium aerolatum TaxID=153731 RepID=UPI0011BF9F88|nr:phospholipase D family protein [Microbacterium aerolatum]